MKKRTTMTIDADNARRLARLQKERDLSWKEAVNTVIRRGLDEAERPFKHEPFRTKAIDPGPARIPGQSVKEMLRDMDDEYARKKLFLK